MKRFIIDRLKHSRALILIVGAWLTFITFDVLWCMSTTFRAMSDISLYIDSVFAALVVTLPYVLTRRVWVQAVALFLLDALLMSNLMYCRTYFAAIPLESYALVGNLADFKASVADSMRVSDVLLPLVTLITVFVASRAPLAEIYRWRVRYATVLVVTGVVAWGLTLLRGGFYAHYDKMAQSCYYSTCGVPVYTVFGDMFYRYLGTDDELTPEKLDMINLWIAGKERLRPHKALPDSVEPRRSMVVILCESLESWVIGREIGGRQITPFIDSLVADTTTLYAPHMLTQVASGRSIDCQLLLNAGMLPMLNSVYSMKYSGSTYHTLTKAMQEKYGSRSYILTCDKPVVWNQELVARAFGIDTLLDRSSWRNDELVGNPAKLSDGSFMKQSVDKMRSGELWPEGESAFVQWVTYSGHNPFVLPDELRDPYFKIPSDWPERMADYVRMAHYTDNALKTLIEYLRSRSDYDDMVIVITGDHEGLASDRAVLLDTKVGRDYVDAGQYTPFIVVNSPVGGYYDNVMGQIDMYPTLLNLMRLDDYCWHGMGRSILDDDKVPAAISSMTNIVDGDTVGVDRLVIKNMEEGRRVSDMIISYDYFGRECSDK